MSTKRIVVLISGSGSNLQAIINACAANEIQGSIVAVISNRPEVYGLERARLAGIATQTLDHKNFADRESFDQALMELIDSYQPDLVVLAGFMRILTAAFVEHYLGRMLNIHPSLLPAYKGVHTHQRALEEGAQQHGASVHFVTAELDAGAVILQAAVPVFTDDTAETLAARVLVEEHKIYPQVVAWFCAGRLVYQDGAAYLDGQRLLEPLKLQQFA
ncbi:MAG: phosphoribosylglycinamide formyltransferase [Thiothrix sp.]|nr:MAG: phosphoribosylglycinamide formyltransferase [Thiothrix sp.]